MHVLGIQLVREKGGGRPWRVQDVEGEGKGKGTFVEKKLCFRGRNILIIRVSEERLRKLIFLLKLGNLAQNNTVTLETNWSLSE